MTRALHFLVALGIIALVLSPAAIHAQAPGQSPSKAQAASAPASSAQLPRADERPISVDYYNVPLRDAVRRLATFGGRKIVMDSNLGDPLVNESIANVHWRRVLDLVVERQGLVARDDKSGVIRIEKRERIQMRKPRQGSPIA
jgi:hypothetical protein